jgi:hypothetical protein
MRLAASSILTLYSKYATWDHHPKLRLGIRGGGSPHERSDMPNDSRISLRSSGLRGSVALCEAQSRGSDPRARNVAILMTRCRSESARPLRAFRRSGPVLRLKSPAAYLAGLFYSAAHAASRPIELSDIRGETAALNSG